MKKYYLAIDIGASSGRHIVGWIENGILKTQEVYRFSNGTESKGGHLVWNMKRLFSEIICGLKKAKETDKIPAYIGIDTWAVDYALLDKEDKLISEVYAYRDSRTIKSADAVHRKIPFNELYKRTGIQYQPFNTIYQLYADKLSGKTDKAESFLMLPDYLNFLLTGVKKQEYTNATSTGLVNAETHGWDGNILEILGFNKKLFGELSQPQTVVGALKKEVAEEIGYDATVILPATHDTASAVLAAPLDEESPYISSGTWSLLGIEQTAAHTDEESRKANYSNEGSIDYKFRYQKNIMGLWMIQSVKRELGGNITFANLADMAKCKENKITVDVNDQRFLSPKNMTAEIKKAVTSNLGTASIMRVIYDSLAKSYAEAIEELERNTGKTYKTLNIIGGGSRDAFLNELTAKATGKKVITGPTEATAIGNLIIQMISAGEIKDLTSARQIIKKSFEVKEI
ncbi:MAG: rhamnulokinase [Clostridia bacterium]|nr:rhamnulokinase [Clostridia bacterium]